MSIDIYNVGEKTIVKIHYTLDNEDIDPNSGSIKVITKSPTGVSTTYIYGVEPLFVKTALGYFQMPILLNEDTTVGKWWIRCEGIIPFGTSTVKKISEFQGPTVRKSTVI